MKTICIALLSFGLLGCATTREAADADVQRAKSALLDLMHSKDNPLEGADSKQFETVELIKRADMGDGVYWWRGGDFRIDIRQHTFSYIFNTTHALQCWKGKFAVLPDGQWEAHIHEHLHGADTR
ncbi:MAG: hypothetical protein K8T91_15425 [Planctomycetes bacterium]|nr:hypothetical protein [Planctomycetota bacterium]